jgi:hypothetical protein
MSGASRVAMRPVLIALACWLAVGCSSLGEPSPPGEAADRREFGGQALAEAEQDRALIRQSSITITVQDLVEATRRIRDITAAAGGTVFNASISKGAYATFTLRVPANELDTTLDALAGLGEEEERAISATDVTDRLTDLEAQLGNKKALRNRLRKLLDRTTTIEDALSIEKELSRLQTEIDTLAARLNRTRSAVAMSSIQVRLNQKVEEPRRILGPLGYLYVGTIWFVKKLFIIYP